MIIILHGPDTYRSWRKLSEIKQKFIRDVDKSSLNITTLEKDQLGAAKLGQELKATPFLAKKRLIIIKNCFDKKVPEDIIEEITKHSKRDSESAILVIYQQTILPTTLLKSLPKAIVQEYKSLEPNEVSAFILGEIKIRGGKMSFSAANFLAQRLGNDTWRISHEIDKLIAYSNNQEITQKEVELLCGEIINDSVFTLIDAIAIQNYSLALNLLQRQFAMDENPIGLFTLIARQFKILYQISDLLKNNKMITSDEVADQLSLHPYAAKKSLQQARSFPTQLLAEIFPSLIELDVKLKSGVIPPNLLLEYFILKQKTIA